LIWGGTQPEFSALIGLEINVSASYLKGRRALDIPSIYHMTYSNYLELVSNFKF